MIEELHVPDPQVHVPDPALLEVPIGIALLVLTILVHGTCLRIISRRFNWAWSRVSLKSSHWRSNLLLAAAISALTLLHLIETLLYAVPLHTFGLFDSLRDSYYFVLECYTTLGEGRLSLPEEWRLLGPIIAMSGLFTFGWTGSVLVSIMAQIRSLDTAQAHQALQEGARHGSDGDQGPPAGPKGN